MYKILWKYPGCEWEVIEDEIKNLSEANYLYKEYKTAYNNEGQFKIKKM